MNEQPTPPPDKTSRADLQSLSDHELLERVAAMQQQVAAHLEEVKRRLERKAAGGPIA